MAYGDWRFPEYQLLNDGHLAGLVGSSPMGRALLRDVARLARGDQDILVRGPEGSGKNAVARAIHQLSLNPGAIAYAHSLSSLWEQAAEARTVVIPDLEAWSMNAQQRLLTLVSEDRGARLILLTREPEQSGAIHQELALRLSLSTIEIPPLRLRGADIELIAEFHLGRMPPDADDRPWQMTTDAALTLRQHDWPGNIRELVHALERACFRAGRTPITVESLQMTGPVISQASTMNSPSTSPTPNASELTIAELERQKVAQVLAEVGGNVTEAGKRLGIPRSTLYRKIKRWGLVGTST